MGVVDEIKAQLDLVDYISQTVKLRRTGKNYIGFCPFHSNTRTPAFVVFPESQTWRCFGQCNEGGDLFGFVMKKEGWDFNETLRFLAEKAGVALSSQPRIAEADAQARDVLIKVLEEAAQFYRSQLVESEAGGAALAYLRHRGLSDTTIKIWGLGYAPAGWDELTRQLTRKGYTREHLLRAGLLTEREDGGTHDKFRHRLMFPIRDTYGKMAGFGGRILNPDDVPKYLNSPRTELFDKGRLLYGLDLARQEIRKAEQAVIVEGYMDVIGLHQAGFGNAVSPMGTALTEDQFKLLKKFTRSIILALDPDAAGEKATLRGLETARQTMDQDDQPTFDSRGLLHFEGRLKADIRVTTLPAGQDPDEIALADPEAWRKIASDAKPVVVHVMETLAAAQDLNDAKVKREIAARVLPLIEDVGDAVERDAYRQQLARLLRVDERSLVLANPVQRRARRSSEEHGRSELESSLNAITEKARSNRMLEEQALRTLVQEPYSLNEINRALGLMSVPQLGDEDFVESDFRQAFRVVLNSIRQDQLSPQDYLAENLPDLFSSEEPAAMIEKSLPPSAQKRLADQVRTVLRIKRSHLETRIQEILFLQSELEEKRYSAEEAEVLLTELIVQRRTLDEAMKSKMAGGDGMEERKPRHKPLSMGK
ncbi:MAG TPA: DNA primase [Anaerolineaceae bacterium]|nr:DNA primase [Anaerolineaceae bacterium]HPS32981.1 DNA primase [Anaerolineaceae bacterium]